MKYRTVVADPPWPFHDARSRPWASKGGRRSRDTFFPYKTQSLDWIKALPVADFAETDAHLYLWVPSGFNRRGLGVEVAEAWGFTVVSEIVWDKINFGLGKFPRPQHEIVLTCRRGTLPFELRTAGSVQRWKSPRGRNNGGKIHSAKPDGFYDLVMQASPGPYLELFARRQRMGWSTWGLECWNDVELKCSNESEEGMQRVREDLPVDRRILRAKSKLSDGPDGAMSRVPPFVRPPLEGGKP